MRELLARLRDRVRRDELGAELDDELRFHRAMLERDARDASASGRTFGNATYYKEEARAMWSLGLVDDLLQDVRYALRALRRDLRFTAAVVVTLALGVGANTAVFSIVNAVMLRPLPYAQPDRLVNVWTSTPAAPADRNPTSLPDLLDWQRQATAFEGIAGFAFNRFDLDGPEGESQARAAMGTSTLYQVLGAQPLVGRLPRADEENAPVVAISYRLWRERFAGRADVVGRQVLMNGTPFTIIGVMPPGFHFPVPNVDLWTTLYSIISMPTDTGPNLWVTSRSLRGYRVVARMKAGVTMPQAERELNTIERRLADAYPSIDGGTAIHLQSMRDDAVSDVRGALWTMFGAAGLIVLLACVNVAHLLLARLSTRDRELAVRRALGAHRGRVLRQLITESVVLGLLGGVAGVAFAVVAMRTLIRVTPADIPRLENVAIDVPTLAFAIAVSILAGLLFGVAPAFLGWGKDLHTTLRARGSSGGAHGKTLRSALTALEVAFAVILLIGAGLMLRTFAELTSADLGARPAGVAVAAVSFVGSRYAPSDAKVRALGDILRDVRALPGVTAAGASTSLPPATINEIEGFSVVGRPKPKTGDEPETIYVPATPGLIDALRIPLIRGRALDDRDVASTTPVVMISAELARRHFAGSDPIGRQLDIGSETRTIVGVVGDVVYEGLGTPIKPVVYVPFAQHPFPGMWIVTRSAQDPAALASAVREAVHRVDPRIAVRESRPLEAMISDSVVRPRFHAWLLGAFGALALLLASVGIYSVVAYGVAQQRAEIGIRLALGAPARSVVGMVLRAGMGPVVLGLAAGLAIAFAASRVVSGLLYGVAPTDGPTFAGVAVVLTMAALLAAYVPARRAAGVDPLSAIRAD